MKLLYAYWQGILCGWMAHMNAEGGLISVSFGTHWWVTWNPTNVLKQTMGMLERRHNMSNAQKASLTNRKLKQCNNEYVIDRRQLIIASSFGAFFDKYIAMTFPNMDMSSVPLLLSPRFLSIMAKNFFSVVTKTFKSYFRVYFNIDNGPFRHCSGATNLSRAISRNFNGKHWRRRDVTTWRRDDVTRLAVAPFHPSTP